MHYIVDPTSSKLDIPWCLEGSFIFSLIGAHVSAAVLHGHACPKWRLETAMTGSLVSCWFNAFLLL